MATEINTPSLTRNFDLAHAYALNTMIANYWYERSRQGDSIAAARALYYDRLALDALNQLNDAQQDVARNIYHTAYKHGKTYRDFMGVQS